MLWFHRNGHLEKGDNSTVVIGHARISMIPLDRAEYADKHEGVRDGVANCGARSRGHRQCSSHP
jgi:hypothetical protein